MITATLAKNLRTPIGTFVAGLRVHINQQRVCVCHTPTSCHAVPLTSVHLTDLEEVPDLPSDTRGPELIDVMLVDPRYPQLVAS